MKKFSLLALTALLATAMLIPSCKEPEPEPPVDETPKFEGIVNGMVYTTNSVIFSEVDDSCYQLEVETDTTIMTILISPRMELLNAQYVYTRPFFDTTMDEDFEAMYYNLKFFEEDLSLTIDFDTNEKMKGSISCTMVNGYGQKYKLQNCTFINVQNYGKNENANYYYGKGFLNYAFYESFSPQVTSYGSVGLDYSHYANFIFNDGRCIQLVINDTLVNDLETYEEYEFDKNSPLRAEFVNDIRDHDYYDNYSSFVDSNSESVFVGDITFYKIQQNQNYIYVKGRLDLHATRPNENVEDTFIDNFKFYFRFNLN